MSSRTMEGARTRRSSTCTSTSFRSIRTDGGSASGGSPKRSPRKRAPRSRKRSLPRSRRKVNRSTRSRAERQPDADPRSRVWTRGSVHLPAVPLHDRTHDPETEPHSSGLRLLAGRANEALEQLRAILLRKAGTRVFHPEREMRLLHLASDADRGGRRRELVRV